MEKRRLSKGGREGEGEGSRQYGTDGPTFQTASRGDDYDVGNAIEWHRWRGKNGCSVFLIAPCLDEFRYASPVAAAHAVHFVHDHQTLLRGPVSAHGLAQHNIRHLQEGRGGGENEMGRRITRED